MEQTNSVRIGLGPKDFGSRLIYCYSRQYDLNEPHLYDLLSLYLTGGCIFVDGPIGAGKSSFISYVLQWEEHRLQRECRKWKKQSEREVDSDSLYQSMRAKNPIRVFPEPIHKIREITRQLYHGLMSQGEANSQITQLCTKEWTTSIEETNGKVTHIIERLPPPFRDWVFENPSTTTFEKEVAKTKERILNGEDLMGCYMDGEDHVTKTLRTYQNLLSKFKHVVVLLLNPHAKVTLCQIAERGRPEERGLSLGYIEYLTSKFDRVAWEWSRESTEPIDAIVERFPL